MAEESFNEVERKLVEGTAEGKGSEGAEGEETLPMIGDYETAPHFMKDNGHITHGYRIHFNTPKKIFRSLFMLHNESVNIWSHCLPAIFILAAIVLFYLAVDREAMSQSLKHYQSGLEDGAKDYMTALQNLSLIVEYNKFSEQRRQDIATLKQTVADNYAILSSSFKDTVSKNTAQFERAKREFELTLAPLMISGINHQLNSTWFNQLKDNLEELKSSIDSEAFQLIQLHEWRQGPQQISRWPIVLFLISAVACLLCSTIFHLFYPMSSKIYTLTNRFDYAGINLLISGSAFPPVYYGMYCQLEVATLYLGAVILTAITLFVVCLFEWIHKPGHEKYKALLFGGFGVSLVIPLVHMMINDFFYGNYGDPFDFVSSFPYYIILGACYLGGLYIYVLRCPERNHPGKYNTCGHSHQIWHGFVLMGIFFTYLGALANFEMRKVSMCPG